MLAPKKQKFRKYFRGKNRGIALRGAEISFGEFALKSIGRALVSANQIESARKAIAHHTKREGKIWLRIFPDRPITAKGAGIRMGSGKGDIKGYVAAVTPGLILFELAGVTKQIATEAFERASAKLPMPTILVLKD